MRLGLKFNEILAKYGGYLSEITKRNLGVVGSKLWLGVTLSRTASVVLGASFGRSDLGRTSERASEVVAGWCGWHRQEYYLPWRPEW